MVYASYQLGRGDRLFGETSEQRPMRLVDSRTLGAGLASLVFEFVHDN